MEVSIVVVYLFIVSPCETGVNLFTLTSLYAASLLPTFINIF